MLSVSSLYIYPIKSLRGIVVREAVVTERGLQYDRQWMLIDENNRFLSQREFAVMALLETAIADERLIVTNRHRSQPPLAIPLNDFTGEFIEVNVWDDICEARLVSKEADRWFTEALGFSCRLVVMPPSTNRLVDTTYASGGETTSFTDGYPFMMLGEESLQELNSHLTEPLSMNRFRPNIVFSGGQAFAEDDLQEFTIGRLKFFGVKLCARCNVTTIDQETAVAGKEPLKAFSKFRRWNNKVYFGQNLLCNGTGVLKVGDEIKPLIIAAPKQKFAISGQ